MALAGEEDEVVLLALLDELVDEGSLHTTYKQVSHRRWREVYGAGLRRTFKRPLLTE